MKYRGRRSGRFPLFRSKSLTFLELLLIIVIISVFLGLSLPRLNTSVKSMSFRSFVSKVYLFLDYAKTNALLTNRILVAKSEPEEGRMALTKKSEDEEKVSIIKDIEIPSGFKMKVDAEKIFFYPDGTLKEFKLIITDNYQHRAVISSRGFDGKIAVSKDSGD